MTKDSTIKFLTQAENKAFFEEIYRDTSKNRFRNRAIFEVGKFCALRASEIGLLRLADYDPVEGKLFCRRLKNGICNTLIICDPQVKTALQEYLDYRKGKKIQSDYLFPSSKGGPISRQRLDALMKSYGKKAGIPPEKQHCHVLRHTRAIELGEHGLDTKEVMYWLGHKRIENTLVYLQFTTRQHLLMYQKLNTERKKI